ncbi:MAG: DUF3352 domain-containing protein [Thermomicrobiales bacterium]|nr:DUF3352 domain-containing protein [Thermomicrobiales bacterium]
MNAHARALPAPSRSRILLTLTMVLMLLSSALAAAVRVSAQGDDHSLASAAPAGTVIYMEVELDQASDQWTKTFELLDRAGLSQVAEEETGASVDELGQTAEQMNISGTAAMVFTDADSLIQYSSTDISAATSDAMALSSEMEGGETPAVPEGFALMIQPDDPEAIAQQFLDMVSSDADTNGAEVQTSDYNGVTITYFESTDNPSANSATAEVNGIVLLSLSPTDLEPIIDTINGDADSLGSEEGFGKVADKLGADNLIFGYINIDAMLTAAASDPEFADELAGLENSGGHAGFSVYASDAGFHADSVFVPTDASTLPAAGDFTPSMASAFPADILLFENANDIYGSGVGELLDSLVQAALSDADGDGVQDEATPTVDESWAMLESQLGFNPNTDLLQKLDGEWAVAASIQGFDPETFQMNPQVLFVSDSSDPATLQNTTDTIAALVQQMNDGSYETGVREVDGGTLQTVTLSTESTSGVPVVIEYGVVNDQLVISVNGAIDDYLAGDSDKLADDANYQAVLAALPSDNVVAISYVNIEGQVLPLLDALVTSLNSSFSTLDNDPACGDYATQQEAQDAYDADSSTLWNLDYDFDGTACEDYFAESTPVEATPESFVDVVHIPAAGSVTWVDDDAVWVSSILLIGQ